MSISLSNPFIKQLVTELFKHESSGSNRLESKKPFIEKIGKIKFKHYKKSGTIDLYTAYPEEPDTYLSYASVVKFKDGKIGILINPEANLFTNANLSTVLFGAIAHELGHYISGHLKDKTKEQEFIYDAVDKNTNKQIALSKIDNKRYFKSTIFGVLKGGVINCELEADIVAVELVGLHTLLMARLFDDSDTINLTCLIEKRNRNNRLMQLIKDGKLEQKNNSKIELILN